MSLSPDSGIIENIGNKLSFEIPYWNGEHPAVDPEDGYPFKFHSLELGEAALKYFFSYVLEGMIDETLIEPEEIPLLRFKRTKQRWKIW